MPDPKVTKLMEKLSKSEVQAIEAKLQELEGKKKTAESKFEEIAERLTQLRKTCEAAALRVQQTRTAHDTALESFVDALHGHQFRQQQLTLSQLEHDRTSSDKFERAQTEYQASFERLSKEREALFKEVEAATQAAAAAREESFALLKTEYYPLERELHQVGFLTLSHQWKVAKQNLQRALPNVNVTGDEKSRLREAFYKLDGPYKEMLPKYEKLREKMDEAWQRSLAIDEKEKKAKTTRAQTEALLDAKESELHQLNEAMERTMAPYLAQLTPKERADRVERKKQRFATAKQAHDAAKATLSTAATAAAKAQQEFDAAVTALTAGMNEFQKVGETLLAPIGREITKLETEREKLLK